jgi:tetratricopeptide (TPR) repeat protein
MLARTLVSAVLTASLVMTPVCLSWAAPSKQDIAAAQEAYKQGIAAEKKGNWRDAREAFEKAMERHDTADTRLHLARAEAQLGHLTEASDHYKFVLELKAAPAPIKAAAKKELAAVTERIPHLTVKVPEGFSGSVRVDKLELSGANFGQPLEVNPGTRTVVAEAEGFKPFSKSVVVSDRANETVVVEMVALAPKQAEEPLKLDTNDGSTRRTLGYVGLGVGAAGLLAGTAFALASRSNRQDLRDACTDNVCSENMRDTYDRGTMQANVATAGFVVAGVGAGVGLVLLLTAPKKKEVDTSAAISPWIGPGSVGLNGRF